MRTKVAFQGARGAFSEEAARKLLGPDLQYVPCKRFEEVFRALADGKVSRAVVPIENTLAGSVHENYDHLMKFRLPIVAVMRMRIVHHLIACPKTKLLNIRHVLSHPVALGQCLQFFEKNRHLKSEVFYDTAGSVEHIIKEGDSSVAAIASAAAAECHGGQILRRSIEDDHRNFTRFFLLARTTPRRLPEGDLQTSIVFSTKNTPGMLFKCMSAFALRDINLLKIESRPLRGQPWEYLFYVDFVGSPDEECCRNAMSHLSEMTELLAVLGCYPQVN